MAGTAIFVLVVALATLVGSSRPPPEVTEPLRWGPPYNIVDFHVETEQYESFFPRLRQIISIASLQEIRDHYVLPKQPQRKDRDQRPCRVVLLGLRGEMGKWVYLYVRLDNLYVLGFINKNREWNMFEDSKHIIPGSHGLTFGSSYKDILGIRGYKRLPRVEVGKATTLAAVDVLSEFRHDLSNDEEIKLALARMLVVFAEAARFSAIRETISIGWRQGTRTTISEQQAEYVVRWSKFSCALIYWYNILHQQHWGSTKNVLVLKNKCGILSADEALSKTDTLLLGRKCEGHVPDTRRGRWC